MRASVIVLLLCAALAVCGGAAAATDRDSAVTFKPLFDLRVRQEALDGVYYFAPDPDRNWIRVRTRAGLRTDISRYRLEVRLVNEHRHHLHPADVDFDWDELILDRGLWAWRASDKTTLTVGRQDIIWDRGFLMLEGHALDGSRSIYHNAVRLQTSLGPGDLDLALIHNPKQDPIVLAGDQDRNLTDADETAVAVRLDRGVQKWSLIWKDEDDPDGRLAHLSTVTGAGRFDFGLGEATGLLAEIALQYQDGNDAGWYDREPDAGQSAGWAVALQTFLTGDLGWRTSSEVGFFFYSGRDGNLLPFRAPWGRWPKWSELYIYSLIGESTPGRINVAAWENVAAPRLTLRRPLTGWLNARLGASYLLAPEPAWEARGVLLQTELKFELTAGLKAHLLWEMLAPGSFHDGRHGLAPLTDTVHFLRWQLSYAL